MITTLLFDFYGVFQPDPYAHWLAENNLTRTGVYADLANAQDTGTITRDEFLAAISKESGVPMSSDSFYKGAMLDTELVTFVRELHQYYRIGLLSNASPSLRQKLADFHIDSLFDSIVISGEIGHAKPDSNSYNAALLALDTTPQQTLFIDDNPSNTAAAAALGFRTHAYQGVAELQQAIAAM